MTSEPFVARLRHAALTRPDDTAFTFLTFGDDDAPAEAPISYGDLDARARSVAAALPAGERVLLLYPPGLDYIVALLGCFYAGAVAVPTYPPFNATSIDTVRRIADDSRPAVVLADGLFAGGDSLAPSARWLCVDDLDTAATFEPRPADVDTVGLLQYTSGSTRHPRGVVLSHKNLAANSDAIRAAFALSADDRAVIWLPPYHDMGLIGGVLQPLQWGFPCVLMSPLDFLRRPLRWLEAVTRHRATVTGAPDFAYSLCAARAGDDALAGTDSGVRGLDLSELRLAFLGAEPIRPATLAAFSDAFGPAGFRPSSFYPCYGLAESTLLVSGAAAGSGARVTRYDPASLDGGIASPADDGRPLVSCGVPAPGSEVVIVDPLTGQPQPSRHVGEIWVRGASVAEGYFEAPGSETFAGRLDEGAPFLRTGDLGFLDDRELVVTGRRDDVIIQRGRNIYPQDLEGTAERAHPQLRIGCVAAFPGSAQDDGPVIVAEVSRGAVDPPLAEMAAAIRGAIAESHGVRLATVALAPPGAVPKTSSGKVRRRQCRALLADGALSPLLLDSADGGPAPVGDSYAATELARRCPGADIDRDRSLVAHGLDSLGATELANAIEADLGVRVSTEELLGGITPAELDRLLDERRDTGDAAEPPLRRQPRTWSSV
ncbi:AMP-binding protein [Micromonospora sp. NPDC049044]|uniref:AMP-binding protein n=1 Tax=unclassified Micromonospora TaxID=2617518 RepID=UPI0033EC53E4